MDEQRKKRTPILRQADGFQRGNGPPKRLRPPLFQSAFNDAQPSSSSSTKRGLNPPPQLMAVRHQPIPALAPGHNVSSSIPMKRHEPPAIQDVQRIDRPLKASKPLSARAPIPELASFSVVPLKPLQRHAPPILDSPANTDLGRELKALSTTSSAALADISSNNDSIELSSVLLQFQEHQADDDLQDHKQDISTSPQKGKYTRGGLAERAARLYKKSHTSLYLWRTALEAQPARQSTPDISFHVFKILHTTFSGIHQPRLFVTLCRVHLPVRPFSSRKQLVYVVLKFPSTSKTSPSCNPSRLQEGCTLRIWQPWYEVALVNPDCIVTAPSASLPLSLSSNGSTSVDPDENTHNTVLLCSRFVINHET